MTDLPFVVPDKITPEVGWRVWRYRSMTADLAAVHMLKAPPWPPGKPHEAECLINQPPRAWIPVSIEEAIEGEDTTHLEWFRTRAVRKQIKTRPPKTRLPSNMAYTWSEVPHMVPAQGCTCGIYATSDITGCVDQLEHGTVLGRVALWGRIIPGEKGSRAEYGYPLDMFVRYGNKELSTAPTSSASGLWPSFWTLMPVNPRDTRLTKQQAETAAAELANKYRVPCHPFEDLSDLREIA